jgi:hypothetical protein
MRITDVRKEPNKFTYMFWKVKSDALANQLLTFTRCLREALSIAL